MKAFNPEARFISKIKSLYIGDDAALVNGLIYSADAFCEGTHFLREWMSPAQVGRKAMLVNLSDAVAMNADPLYALVTVMLPRDFGPGQIDELAGALKQTAAEFGCEIIGGDTVAGEELHLSVTLISCSDAPLLRGGIQPGDLLAYTGTLGESKRNLEALMRGENIPSDSRFYEPVLRRDFVRKCRKYLRAGMDLSDGLYCDTDKLLDYNGLGMELLQEIPEAIGSSGEEYEMLVAVAPENLEALRECARKEGVPLNVFARVEENDRRFPCRDHHLIES
ncbi:Thiamine-phosphate kinase [Nitratifractor salsuginis DSM 16511]|uniref:Thiamine-monophosphate kinase n=2 Tax=Nitratifractor salsuginis TaxID=269261 RepID=E6WXS6_NITSE|nr:Thiamine-phosphate kinase [Nitratifractor salsuginis DSM 16511]